ncbi:9243_t:CDS:2 [Funneliformis mosseae]|uniref:9243_t:CDS:1 n=1 Tax=Funneliformis mosseae TaxID=27381 RepID=A0A9N9C5K4_FUNMO|nr:9243_t:CDS:2 [Funneliformis mosseae]
MNLIVQLVILGIIFIISSKLLRGKQQLNLNEPPLIPYKYPIIGHTFDYYRDTEKFIKKCSEEYGEIFSLYVFGKVITFVGKELYPEVFKSHKDFDFDIAFKEKFPLERFMNRPDKFFAPLPKIIFTFLSQSLSSYAERVQKTLIEAIDELIGDGKVIQNPLNTFQLIIARPIAACLVGEEFSDDKELVNTVAYATSDLVPYLSFPPFLSFIHPLLHKEFLVLYFQFYNPFKVHRDVIKRKVSPIVERRLHSMKTNKSYVPPVDILQKLIELLSQDYTIDIDVLTDYVIVAIFAAVHTTSTFLLNSLHQYANYPQFQKELLEEQERLLKSKNGKTYYTTEDIDKLVYLDSFFKETLRLSTSIVYFEHMTLNSHFTFSNGYQVPKDRFVYIRVQEIHRDEELQGQNPKEFNPFRHLGKSLAAHVEKNFIAFSFGKHACPGRYFAANEIKSALHYLILNYNIKHLDDKKVYPKIKGPFRFASDEGLVLERKGNNV